MKHTKRLLAMLLMVCMVLSMLPVTALTASAADVILASWGKVSLAANSAVDASTYQGTTAPTLTSNKAMTTSGKNCYYGSSAGGAEIVISGLPSGYTTKEITFYTRASQTGNMSVSVSTDNGATYTEVGSPGITKSEALKTVTLATPVSDVTNIKFAHNKSSGSLYFGTVTVTGEAASSYTVTASADPAAGGTVTINGTTVTATPNEGYYVTGEYVADDGITVTYNGDNTFTFSAYADGEIVIEFKQKSAALLTYSENGTSTNEDIAYVGDSVTLLAPQNAAPLGYTFMGWLPTTYAASDTAPTGLLQAGDSYTLPTEYCTVYAVYARAGEGGGSGGWTETELSAIADGTRLVIVSSKASSLYALSNDNGTGSAPDAVSVTASGTSLASDPADTIIWTLEKSEDGYRFKSGTDYLYCNSSNNGVRVGTNANNLFTVDADNGYLKNTATSRYLGVYNNSDWRCYTNTTGNTAGQTFLYYAEQAGTSYTGYTTNVDSSVTYTLDSIAITTAAAKTEFSLGELFSYDGMVVTATYTGSDGSTKQVVVTPTGVSAPDMTAKGTQIVTVTFTDSGVTRTATYEITVKATYTLTYDANTTDEVTGMPEAVTDLEEGSVYTLSTDVPVRAGYDFYGWALSASSDTDVTSVTMDGNKTVYAIWLEKNKYTVSFYSKEGTTPVTKEYYEGDTIAAEDVPAIVNPDGFAFKGWYGGTYESTVAPSYATPAGTTVNRDLTFYAVYAQLGEGGSADTFTLSYTYNGTTYYAKEQGSTTYIPASLDEADAAVYGLEAADGGYYVYYLSGDTKYYIGGSGTGTALAKSSTTPSYVWTATTDGDALTLKIGNRFLGLNTSTKDRFSTYASGYPLTMTAAGSSVEGYTTNPVVVGSHTVTWYNADGSVFATTTVRENASIIAPRENPVKADEGETYYTFSGWAKTASASTALTDLGKMGTADMSFYPVFTAEEYTFTAAISGGTEIVVGETAQLTAALTSVPAGAEPSGYTLTWTSDNAAVTVDADGKVSATAAGSATITATFTKGSKVYSAEITVTATVEKVYTLITPRNAPEDWTGEYVIAGRYHNVDTYANTYAIFSAAFENKIPDSLSRKQSGSNTVALDDTGIKLFADGTEFATNADGSIHRYNGEDLILKNKMSGVSDEYVWVVECVDDVNGYYTIKEKNYNVYLAAEEGSSTNNTSNMISFSLSADGTLALWQFEKWVQNCDTENTNSNGEAYTNEIIVIRNVGEANRLFAFNTYPRQSSKTTEIGDGWFRTYIYGSEWGTTTGMTGYADKLGNIRGNYASAPDQVFNVYLFGNPNPFKAQIYYSGEQITLANTGTIPYGRETAALTSALSPSIDDYPNWETVGTPTWSIIEKNNAMVIDPETGVITTNNSASGTYAVVQVTYVVHDKVNDVDYTISTQAKVVVGEPTATYSTVIFETLSGADTEVQYTVYKTESTSAADCVLPLDAYVVNDLTGVSSKTGSVVRGGTAVWSVVNNTDASETVSIGADGKLTYANITKDSILTVTVTGLTGDGIDAGTATYKVYVKRVSYTAQITHDNGATGDFTVPYGANNIPLDKLVKNADGATTGFTLDESKLTWATNNAGAVITKNADGTAKLDVSALPAGTVVTVYVSGMTATAENVTANVPRASVKITVGEQATDVVANDDTVIIDYDRAVTIPVLANDIFTNTAAARVTLNGAANGFTVNADMTVTYRPEGMLNETVSCTYTVTAANGSSATATITVKPAAAIYYEDSNSAFTYTDGKHGAWTTLGTETVTEQTASLTAADIVEYDTNYDGVYAQYSAGSVHKVNVTKAESNAAASVKNPLVEFDFAGTGFDVVSVTSNNTGAFMVQVTKGGKNVYSKLISTYRGYQYVAEGFESVAYQQAVRCDENGNENTSGAYSKVITGADGSFTVHYETEGFFVREGEGYVAAPDGAEGPFYVKRTETHYWQPVDDAENLDYYQIPVLKVDGLDYGAYHVKITAAYTTAYDIKQDGEYDFFFDAVRVHDPIDNEARFTYISVRDAILEAGGFGSAEAEPCGHTGSTHWELGTKASYNASETLNGRGKLAEKCDVCGNVIRTAFFYVVATANATALSTETAADSAELSYTVAVDGSAPAAAESFLKSQKFTGFWKSGNAAVVNCYNNANVAYAAGAGTTYVTLQLTAADGTVFASAIHTADLTVTGHTHAWGSSKVTLAATCTTAGIRTYSCTVSGCTKTKTENIQALGHNYGDWSTDSNEHWHVCTRCGDAADRAAHNMVYDEALDKDVCSVCGYVAGSAAHTHSYTAAVTKEATCAEAGIMTYTCSCGDSYTEEIPATGNHSYSEYVENGADTHYASCAVCGDITEEPHTFDAGVTSGSTITYTCTKCGYQKTQTVEVDTGVYTAVTNAAQLKPGSTIVIAASGYDYAVSSTQGNNNRSQVAITKAEDGTLSFADDAGVAEFTLGAGSADGTYSFKDANGYLYAASSSKNYLRSESELSDNSSWTIEIAEDGTATVTAQGTNTRNLLRYNQTSKLFSCYASGQKEICLYQKLASAESAQNTADTTEKRSTPEEVVGGVTGTAIIDGMGSAFSMEEFEKYGPKTEVYLSENQAVIFYLENGMTGTDVQIGAKAVNGTPANLTVITLRGASAGGATLTKSAPLVTATEMYYEIGGDLVWNNATSCAVVVANTGKGVMALTNVRSTAAIKLQINRATADAGRSVMQRVAENTMIYGMDDFTTLLDSSKATNPTLPEDPIDPDEPKPTEPTPDPKDFRDLEEGAWYYEGVSYAVKTGLMNGIGDQKFDPDGTLTRAMLVTILYRQAGEPSISKRASFADVEEKSWYANAVAWAVESGITNGVGDNRFAPDEPVTREQMVTFLWRFVGEPKSAQTLAAFPDAGRVSDYAKTAFAWAVEEKIVNGDQIGNKVCLDPNGNATRAQIATIFMRSKNLLAND